MTFVVEVLAGGAQLIERLLAGELATRQREAQGDADLPVVPYARARWLAVSCRAAAGNAIEAYTANIDPLALN